MAVIAMRLLQPAVVALNDPQVRGSLSPSGID